MVEVEFENLDAIQRAFKRLAARGGRARLWDEPGGGYVELK